jgi:hypothetical protein
MSVFCHKSGMILYDSEGFWTSLDEISDNSGRIWRFGTDSELKTSDPRPSKTLCDTRMSGCYKKCVTNRAVVGLRPRFLYDRTIPSVHNSGFQTGFEGVAGQ